MVLGMAAAVPLTLVSHTGTSSSSANVGGILEAETDTPSSLTDVLVSTSASSAGNVSGTGAVNATSASASTLDRMSTSSGDNVFTFSHSANFFAADFPGFNPGGASSASIDALWLLTLDVENIELTYAVSFLSGSNVTSSSSLTVRNATTNTDILGFIDPGTVPSASLNFGGSIGDQIEISLSGQSDFSGAAGAPSVLSRTRYTLAFAESATEPSIVPEPGAMAIFGLGLMFLACQRRRNTA